MSVHEWLMDSDPAIRWQVMQHLTDATPDVVAAERALVATTGWGARLLAEQAPDGRWDGGTYRPGWVDEERPMFDAWTATHFSLQQLRDFGVDASDPAVVTAIARVRENVRWEHENERYFEGETEPCINGIALAVGASFGQDSSAIVTRLLSDQLPDGGWNCWTDYGARVSSFHSTITALEGLLAWEQVHGANAETASARARGEEYLLERGLMNRRSTGTAVDPRFTMLSYPTRWYYDVLWGLDYMRRARPERDHRCAAAIDLLRSKQDASGRWPLQLNHEGPTLFSFGDEEGEPSRWVTLRALRVLRWWDEG